MKNMTTTKSVILDMNFIALFAVIIAICSWISIPGQVPFTLQTMGVMLAVGTLGGKRGSIAVLLYIVLGLIGVPVFAGFKAGPAAILGPTGGYIVGFIVMALVMWLFEALFKDKTLFLVIGMVVGLLLCYLFGTVWFVIVYARETGPISFWTALTTCVIPYLIPDALKMVIAVILCKRLKGLFAHRKVIKGEEGL